MCCIGGFQLHRWKFFDVYVDAIYQKSLEGAVCRVSDVSGTLKITMPSVTKLINELQEFGMVVKRDDVADRRTVLLELTELGEEYERKYVADYQAAWVQHLRGVSDDEAETAISVIEQLFNTIPKKEEISDAREQK